MAMFTFLRQYDAFSRQACEDLKHPLLTAPLKGRGKDRPRFSHYPGGVVGGAKLLHDGEAHRMRVLRPDNPRHVEHVRRHGAVPSANGGSKYDWLGRDGQLLRTAKAMPGAEELRERLRERRHARHHDRLRERREEALNRRRQPPPSPPRGRARNHVHDEGELPGARERRLE